MRPSHETDDGAAAAGAIQPALLLDVRVLCRPGAFRPADSTRPGDTRLLRRTHWRARRAERVERDCSASGRPTWRGVRVAGARESLERVATKEPRAPAAEPVRRYPARLRPARTPGVDGRDNQPLPRRPRDLRRCARRTMRPDRPV